MRKLAIGGEVYALARGYTMKSLLPPVIRRQTEAGDTGCNVARLVQLLKSEMRALARLMVSVTPSKLEEETNFL